MPLLILALFIGIPLVEIAVFIQVGGQIGLWNTIAIVILTAVIGTWMLRAQGLKTLENARRSMERNILPVTEVFDGLCLLVAGALLLTPGFVTDALGFLLFLPPFRGLLRGWAGSVLQRREGTRIWVNGEEVTQPRPDDGTIDGDYREIDPEGGRPSENSPWRPDDDDRDPPRLR